MDTCAIHPNVICPTKVFETKLYLEKRSLARTEHYVYKGDWGTERQIGAVDWWVQGRPAHGHTNKAGILFSPETWCHFDCEQLKWGLLLKLGCIPAWCISEWRGLILEKREAGLISVDMLYSALLSPLSTHSILSCAAPDRAQLLKYSPTEILFDTPTIKLHLLLLFMPMKVISDFCRRYVVPEWCLSVQIIMVNDGFWD